MNDALTTSPPDSGSPLRAPPAVQRIIKVRRDYNSWVASETMEDYALRYTPQRFRKWSEWRVANTAFGAASFLILEAVGATLLVQYGFANAFWAILVTGLIIFLAGLPISIYAARYGLDMDLLTRGAGFGYLGSTGLSTGPHLHFEFRVNGKQQDPRVIARASEAVTLPATAKAAFKAQVASAKSALDAASSIHDGVVGE